MNEKKKFWITFAIAAVMVIGAGVLLYFQLGTYGWGWFKNEESLTTEIENLKKKIAKEEARIKKIPEKKTELAALQEDMKVASQLLPRESTPHQLLGFIYQKAEEAETTITSLDPERPEVKVEAQQTNKRKRRSSRRKKKTPEKRYEEWLFKMKLEGTYDQICTFINKMEEFEIDSPDGEKETRFFTVSDLDMKSKGGGMEEGARHSCDLVMKTFRYLDTEKK